MEEVFCKNDLKSKGGYKHMPFLPQFIYYIYRKRVNLLYN